MVLVTQRSKVKMKEDTGKKSNHRTPHVTRTHALIHLSSSFAFAVSKTLGRRNYFKTRSVKYFLDKVRNNLRLVLKPLIA